MATYYDTLEIMKKKLLDFIDYLEASKNESFTYTIIESLKEMISSSASTIEDILSVIKQQEDFYTKSFLSLSKDYNEKIKALDEELENKISSIKQYYIVKKIEIQDEIQEKHKDISFEEFNTEMDIEFFITSSEQNIELFEHEYEDNIARYDYQLKIAKEDYAQNTILFNDALEKDLENLKKEYITILENYDKDTERIIEHYKKNEDELNSVYNSKIEEFNTIQTENKNNKRQESMELNDKIRALASIRNEKVLAARQEYAKKQAETQSDKDAKHQEFQMENQKISREFIANMGSLDERTSKLKNEYMLQTDTEKRLLQYKLLELKNEEEKELEHIYFSPFPSKREIRAIKSMYFKYATLERKNTEKTLKNLSKSYLMDVEKTQYEKKLLDLDRNYDIKSVLEHEVYNNKVFQENNNEYENDMNLLIQLHNLEYNGAANTLRTENTLKILKDEKAFDEKQALHGIETEKLLCSIKSINYEIESFEEIRKLLHHFEDEKFRMTSNFKTVNNVLEIEKCKVLDTLNHSLHELNSKSTTMVLRTSKEATELKNKQYRQKLESQMERNQLVLNSEEKLGIYQVECLEREEAFKINSLNRTYFYDLDTLGHEFLNDKYKLEYKKIMQNLSLISQLVETAEYLCMNLLNYIIHNINVRPDNIKVLRDYIREFASLVFEEIQRFIEDFHTIIDGIIQERLDFEESLKYQGFYRNIESQYKEDIQEENQKKTALIKEIEELTARTEKNKSALYAIENELLLRRKKMKNDRVPYKVFKDEINQFLSERKIIESDNQKYQKRILILNKEISHIDNLISQINLSYTRQQDDIRKLQITNAQSYYELKRNMDRHISIYIGEMSSKIKITENQEIDFTGYTDILKQKVDFHYELTSSFLKGLYTLVYRFSNNEREAIEKSLEILISGYKTDISELERDNKNDMQDASNTFNREEALRNEDIERFDREVNNKMKAIAREISNHEQYIKKCTQDIQNEINEANQTFYDDYYSICANQDDITAVQERNMTRLSDEYERNRILVFERFKKMKEQLKESLQEYIVGQNEVLKHLPTAEREQEKSIHDEAARKQEEMEQNHIDIKTKNSLARRDIKKNKGLIEAAFLLKQEEMDKEHKESCQKEKKNHLIQMKHLAQ